MRTPVLLGGTLLLLGLAVSVLFVSQRNTARYGTNRLVRIEKTIRTAGGNSMNKDMHGNELSSSNSQSNSNRRPSKLADGCNSVYLDLGSNIGVQIRKLFEPELYPDCKSIKYFEKILGPVADRKLPGAVCVFGFEPNPIHLPRLKEIEQCYNKKGWRVKILPYAVSNSNDEKLKFYLDKAEDNKHWMSTLFPGGHYHDTNQQPVIVDSIDIADFVVNEILGRETDSVYPGSWKPTIYAKFDVEGSEYQALTSLLFKGALCHMTISSIEWHRELMERNMGLEAAQKYQDLRELLVKLLSTDPKLIGCKPMLLERWDDEDYHTDGKPLPAECT